MRMRLDSCRPILAAALWVGTVVAGEGSPTATGFQVTLPPPPFANELRTNSLFGANTALDPAQPNVEDHLRAMAELGIKWARQDFNWRRIERLPGEYQWQPYDDLVEKCRERGIQLLGCLTDHPAFHNPLTDAGVDAFARFAELAAKRYTGRVDHWQIWNEPNGGFWKGTATDYARLLMNSGIAIHGANRDAKVVALNMAFCDVLWARQVLRQVPSSVFDIVAFHPYRPPNAPEEAFDFWTLDQYVKTWHAGLLPTNYAMVNMTFLEQTAELVRVMDELGRRKPLWITEMCWNSHLHPYGNSELRQADLLVRFHALALGSQQIAKVFWWALRDQGVRAYDQADMVGLARFDWSPKYAYAAYGWMTRMLEGKQWLRNDAFGPEVFVVVFNDPVRREDCLVAWSIRPVAYIRVNNTERGLAHYDLYGTRRFIEYDALRTGRLSLPVGESPIYLTGAEGLQAVVRAVPGW